MHSVHLWLDGKRIVDFLLVIIEFFASSHGWGTIKWNLSKYDIYDCLVPFQVLVISTPPRHILGASPSNTPRRAYCLGYYLRNFYSLWEASCAKTHASRHCFCDLWPWPALIVEYFYVKFGDLSYIGFWDIVREKTDTQTNSGENPSYPVTVVGKINRTTPVLAGWYWYAAQFVETSARHPLVVVRSLRFI